MKYLIQFLIILVFSFVGEVLSRLLPMPIPASIYGIILLFLALETKLIKVEKVNDASEFLIKIMPIMFVPPAVGLIDSWQLVKESLIEYSILLVITTFIVMVAAGKATQCVIRKNKNK